MAIWSKFKSFRDRAAENMTGSRLDRHKLASCICGAILDVKPIVGFQGAIIVKKANEMFALCVGLNVIKAYMLEDLLNSLDVEPQEKRNIHLYIKEGFDMQFPENICDHQGYEENFINALYWCHHRCDRFKVQCFQYDIWAYSKLFYHLKLYNQACIRQKPDEYQRIKNRGPR